MPVSVRYYAVPDDGPLRLVPQRVVEGLYTEADAIPEFADSRRRVVQVVLDNERGKPVRVLDVMGVWWEFLPDGRLNVDREWMRWAFDWEDRPGRPRGKVVDLRPKLERAQWKARHRWEVTGEIIEQVITAVWPGNAAAGEAIKIVAGTAPKRPPLTRDGERAMATLSGAVSQIEMALEDLSERALKGVAHEAREYATAYAHEAALWAGIAGAAERQLAIVVQRRTGRGVWYASVRMWLILLKNMAVATAWGVIQSR